MNNLFEDAKRFAIDQGSVSIVGLARHLHIGYARAGRILDKLLESGIIEKSKKPRFYNTTANCV